MRTTPHLRLTLLAACAGLALAGAAHAAPILNAASSASTGAPPVAATPSTFSDTGYTGSYSNANTAVGAAYGQGFAKANGAYAVGSTAQGIGSGAGQASIQTSVTNTSSVAQQYSMSFYIYGGSISTYVDSSPLAALASGEFMTASFMASIKVNNALKFSAAATVNRNDAGTTGSITGTDLSNGGNDATDGEFSWGSQYHTIDLGLVAAGATVDVLAELSQQSLSNVGTYTYTYDGGCCPGNGYGYGGDFEYGGCEFPVLTAVAETQALAAFVVSEPGSCSIEQTSFKGSASGFYGDPFTFTGSPQGGTGALGVINQLTFTSAPVGQAVPEPGAFGLAALGLLAVGAARRRRPGR